MATNPTVLNRSIRAFFEVAITVSLCQLVDRRESTDVKTHQAAQAVQRKSMLAEYSATTQLIQNRFKEAAQQIGHGNEGAAEDQSAVQPQWVQDALTADLGDYLEAMCTVSPESMQAWSTFTIGPAAEAWAELQAQHDRHLSACKQHFETNFQLSDTLLDHLAHGQMMSDPGLEPSTSIPTSVIELATLKVLTPIGFLVVSKRLLYGSWLTEVFPGVVRARASVLRVLGAFIASQVLMPFESWASQQIATHCSKLPAEWLTKPAARYPPLGTPYEPITAASVAAMAANSGLSPCPCCLCVPVCACVVGTVWVLVRLLQPCVLSVDCLLLFVSQRYCHAIIGRSFGCGRQGICVWEAVRASAINWL